jgi:large subunit ribosomal protein L28
VNLQAVKAIVNGAPKRLRVCANCIKSGKIIKSGKVAKEVVAAPAATQA